MSPIESISIPEASQPAPPLNFNSEERIRLAQLETLIEGSLEKFSIWKEIRRAKPKKFRRRYTNFLYKEPNRRYL